MSKFKEIKQRQIHLERQGASSTDAQTSSGDESDNSQQSEHDKQEYQSNLSILRGLKRQI